MKQHRKLLAVALAMAAAGYAGGCDHPAHWSDGSAESRWQIEPDQISPSLIMMPSGENAGFARGESGPDEAAGAGGLSAFDYSRNDWSLGALGGQDFGGVDFLEIRHREFLRTIDGRTRDFSSTFTESIRRRLTR